MSLIRYFLSELFSKGKRPMLKQDDVAPDFEALDQNGNTVRLEDFRGKKVVLWFYPNADTPG